MTASYRRPDGAKNEQTCVSATKETVDPAEEVT